MIVIVIMKNKLVCFWFLALVVLQWRLLPRRQLCAPKTQGFGSI